jgi:hypothetical protein
MVPRRGYIAYPIDQQATRLKPGQPPDRRKSTVFAEGLKQGDPASCGLGKVTKVMGARVRQYWFILQTRPANRIAVAA